MRLKKVFSLFLVAVFLLTSQSAFASTGVGDTKDKAITIFPYHFIDQFLSDPTDVDWYKLTNNTGEDKLIYARLYVGNNPIEYTFGLVISYENGFESELVYAADLGPTIDQVFTGIIIPKNATAYLVVGSKKFDIGQYKLYTFFSDVP